MTNQPVWETVVNLGDVNVADYGGFIVKRDTTGVYAPEVEMYEPNQTHEGTGGTLYRFSLDSPRFKTLTEKGRSTHRFGSPLPMSEKGDTWHWYEEWYMDKLQGVADCCGTTWFALARLLVSKNPVDRGLAYQMLVGYFGPYEFDSYPITLTEEEAQERYKD
jgi:hypothetical protein